MDFVALLPLVAAAVLVDEVGADAQLVILHVADLESLSRSTAHWGRRIPRSRCPRLLRGHGLLTRRLGRASACHSHLGPAKQPVARVLLCLVRRSVFLGGHLHSCVELGHESGLLLLERPLKPLLVVLLELLLVSFKLALAVLAIELGHQSGLLRVKLPLKPLLMFLLKLLLLGLKLALIV